MTDLADADAGDRARTLLVLDAVRRGRMTWRAGAEVLGVSMSAFLDLAIEAGLSVQLITEEDWAQDLRTLDELAGRSDR